MEGDKFIINSNNSCLLCFKKMGEDYQQSFFPLHQLTRKLNLDFRNVFLDVVPRFGEDSSQLLCQLQLFCDLCENCSESCREIEMELTADKVKSHVKMLLDKMTNVELLDEYKRARNPLGLIHFGTVERLRKEMIIMLSRFQIREKRKQTSSNPVRPFKKRKVDENFSQIVTRSMAAQKAGEMIRENPFENDIVISNTLSFLKIEEVKRCRLINKQWNRNSYQIIKQIVADSWLKLQAGGITELESLELLSLLENGSQLPLARKVHTDTSFLEVLQLEGNLFRFLNAVSPNLKELVVTSRYKIVGPDIGYPESLTFPQLECIDFYLRSGSVRFTHFDFFRKLVLNSPRLVEICVGSEKVRPSWFQPLINLLERGVGKRLTSLILKSLGSFNSAQYNKLTEIGMKLKRLRVEPMDKCAVSVSHFLKSQSESVEELEIASGASQFDLEGIIFPRLKVLKCMKIGNDWNSYRRISYKKQFPVLEQLLLDYLEEHELDMFLHSATSQNDIGYSVRELVNMDNSTTLPEHIENASYLFPNLTKLEISADLKILMKVYARMRKLQELTLEFDMCNYDGIDNILMGLEPYTTDCHCSCGKCDIYFHFNPDESLLALTELRTLRIRCIAKNFIGDNACRRVLMKMKSLKLIKFYGFRGGLAKTGISNLMLDEMRKKMEVLATKC